MSSDTAQRFRHPGLPGFDAGEVQAPIVIGVSGHRDIREEHREALQQKIKDILSDLRNRYGSSPLVLLSALAEGADRLAAHAALSLDFRVRLFVPLPLPRTLYEEDFIHCTPEETLASLLEFRKLLDQAEDWFELPLAAGNTCEAIARQGPERNRQYEMVGKYIAQKSQILIALWDGLETGLVGGTSSVVHYQTEGVPGTNPHALDPPEGSPVYHILTPRMSDPYPQGEFLSLRRIYPRSFEGDDDKAEKYYHRMFSRIDEFNRYVAQPDAKLRDSIAQGKKYLLQDLPEHDFEPPTKATLNRYAIADALAIRFREQMVNTQRLLHWLVFLAVFSFVLFSHLPEFSIGSWHIRPQLNSFLASSILLAVLATVLAYAARRQDCDTNYQDYRAMAEGLRVKFFWRLSGVADSVADHYLGKQRTELDWIRNGLRGWNVSEDTDSDGQPSPDANLPDRIAFARKYWVEDQQRYFMRTANREERKSERHKSWIHGLLAATLIAAIVLFLRLWIADWICDRWRLDRAEWLLALPIMLIELLLAGAALIHHYSDRMAHAEHAKQYNRMAAIFARALDLIPQKLVWENLEDAQCCLRQIGKEALAENGDWVLLHRERPLEVPHP